MAHDFVKFPELTNSQMQEEYFNSPHKQIVEDFRAKVVKVTDGDTIRVEWHERDFDFPVRMLDINAPEMAEGGKIARDWLANQIENAEVEILIDQDQRVGKYGRLLGKILHRGLDMGETMVHLGLAKPFEQRNEDKIILDLGDQKWL